MFSVVVIPTPALAVVGLAALLLTVIIWTVGIIYLQRRSLTPPAPLSWEIVDGTPVNRRDLYIDEKKIALLGAEYQWLGNMPVRFLCPGCRRPDDIDLRLYRHVGSNTTIILSRHDNCSHLQAAAAETVEMPVVKHG